MRFPLRIVVALSSEAKPICKYFALKHSHYHSDLFKVFFDKSNLVWLIVSGIGCINASAASIYLKSISDAPPWSLWVNLGTAGHKSENIGKIFTIKKVMSDFNAEVFYTGNVAKRNFLINNLISVNKKEEKFTRNDCLYDMEAIGFIKTIEKFVDRELICILKIVSDNKLKNSNLDIKGFSKLSYSLIENKLEEINKCIDFYYEISVQEKKRLQNKLRIKKILFKYKASFNEKVILERLIEKWVFCFPKNNIVSLLKEFNDPSKLINYLKKEIELVN